MKKIFTYTVLAVLSTIAMAQAAFIETKADTDISVAHAKELKNNAPVRLKGNIVESLGDEKYLFSDGKETIIVEIDNEDWAGQDVSAQDFVIIVGEMDKDFFGTEVDVEAIQLVK